MHKLKMAITVRHKDNCTMQHPYPSLVVCVSCVYDVLHLSKIPVQPEAITSWCEHWIQWTKEGFHGSALLWNCCNVRNSDLPTVAKETDTWYQYVLDNFSQSSDKSTKGQIMLWVGKPALWLQENSHRRHWGHALHHRRREISVVVLRRRRLE